jgi:hypothetical protein
MADRTADRRSPKSRNPRGLLHDETHSGISALVASLHTDGTIPLRACTISACPLFEFRFGKNPNIVRAPERKAADAKRLALLRASLPPRPAGNAEVSAAHVLEGGRATRQATG